MRWERRDDSWLTENNSQPWSWSTLRDAQKESIIAILVSSVLIMLLWRGMPTLWHRNKLVWVQYDDGDMQLERRRMRRWVHPLWPFKMMTVLFHEICHAIVGTLTGGRVKFIRVDAWEGGLTVFAAKHQPNYVLALPAGYIGSCTTGCGLLYCGFDALTAKYAALALGGGLIISFVICLAVKPKLAWRHYASWRKMLWARWRGSSHEAKKHEEDHQEQVANDPDADRMVSLDVIGAVALCVSIILGFSWYIADSIALRFWILFLGTMAILYAVADVYIDGWIHAREEGSDCHEFARRYHKRKDTDDADDAAVTRWTHVYAISWVVFEISLGIVIMVLALRHFTETMAEQAVESRTFLPTPNRWSAAEAWEEAQQAAENAVGG